MISSCSDTSGRRRLPRLTIARRLAAGVPPKLAASGTKVPPQAVEALLTERGFQRTVAVYRELLSAPHELRLQRLYELALQVLEQALAEGCRLTLFYMLHERARGRDPVARLVEGIDRKLKAAPPPEPAAPPPTPRPAATSASAPEPSATPAATRRPDPIDVQARRTAARLRGQMIDEAALAAADPAVPGDAAREAAEDEPKDDLDLIDPVADPLGAAVHRLHREADRRDAAERRAAQGASTAAASQKSPPPRPDLGQSPLLAAILAKHRPRDGPNKS